MLIITMQIIYTIHTQYIYTQYIGVSRGGGSGGPDPPPPFPGPPLFICDPLQPKCSVNCFLIV